MKIDAYNKVAQLYQTNNKTTKIKETKAKAKAEKDKLEISQFGHDINIAKNAVAKVADIREDKIAEIKEKMSQGAYEMSNTELADKLVEKFTNSIF